MQTVGTGSARATATPRATTGPLRTTPQRARRSWHGNQLLMHVLPGLASLLILVPFLWLVLASLRNYDDLIARPLGLPRPFTLANYYEIFAQANFGQAFLNSVVVAGGRVVFACATSVAVGYIFAKYRFRGRDMLFFVLLSTMLVPFPAILVPLYLTLSEVNLLDSITGLVVISVFSTFGAFLLRQWIVGIPDDYVEAARLDGASEFWIVVRIIAPLSRPPLAALAIFTFLFSWDDYLFPNVVLTSPDTQTLPLVLAGLRSLYWERYELYSAGAMVTVVPVMLFYAFMQRHFVRGLTMGGLKE